MKRNYLPAILVSVTLLVGVNLWAIERDQKMLKQACVEQGLFCIVP